MQDKFLDYVQNYPNRILAEAVSDMYNVIFEGVPSDINPAAAPCSGIPEPSGMDTTVDKDEYFDEKDKKVTFPQSNLVKELIQVNNKNKNGYAPNVAPPPQRTSLGMVGTSLPQNVCADTSGASSAV